MAPPKAGFSFSSQPSASSFSFSSPSSQPSSSTLPFSFANPTAPKKPTPLFSSITADAFGSTTSASSNNGSLGVEELDVDLDVDADADADVVYLEPAAWPRNGKAKWKASGRTLLAAVSPVGGEVAAWSSKLPSSNPDKPDALADPKLSMADRTLYFASLNKFSDAVQNLYAETYTLFISLQRIVASSLRLPIAGLDGDSRALGVAEVWDSKGNLVSMEGLLGPPGAETVVHMRRLVDMYLEEVGKLRHATDVEDDVKIRYESVFHVFSLAEILYLPQDGRGEGLLGEELLDWVNAVDTIHINTQGNDIMQTKEPWEHPLFWPFISRCILRGFFLPASSFLRTLSSHPHPPIAKLGLLLSTHVSAFPRSTNTVSYPLDHQFLAAHKMWLARFRAEFTTFLGGRGRGRWLDEGNGSGRSEWASWEDDLRTVVELMEGKPERLFEESADWREAIGAWGVLVDVSLRRDDLPGVISRILDKIPVDSTILEDTIQSSLCAGDIVKALMGCHDLDIWLAAHLGDIFDKLALVPDDEERFDTSLRDYFLLEYTDLLQDSPSHTTLWRVIAEYLSAAGDEGRNRLREFIVHVGLGLDRESKGKSKESESTDGMDVEGEGVESKFQHFTELRETCVELKLDNEWRMISSIMADRLIRRGDLGLAASMCLSAEDGYTLSRIAEKILDAYIEKGDQEFLRLVDTLPPTMLNEAPMALSELQLSDPNAIFPITTEGTSQTTMVMFASRLTFLSEFRDYLLYTRQSAKDRAAIKLVNLLTSGITPLGFWAVLLAESVELLEDSDILFNSNDTFELMRVLEEVLSNASYAPVDYLRQLWRHLDRLSGLGTAKQNGMDEREIKEGTARAKRKLDEVRLALARNLARALVVGFDNPF